MRSLPRRAAAMTIVAILALSGCGGGDGDAPEPAATSSSTASASAPDPADGRTIQGTDYSYTVPKGWETPSQKPAGFDFDSLAADRTDKDGFADNINVIVQDPAPAGITSEVIESQIADQLKKQGAKDVAQQDPEVVDGEKATHVSSSQELNGRKNATEQYYVLRDQKFYVITFSYSTSLSESDRDRVSGSILTTWKWAS